MARASLLRRRMMALITHIQAQSSEMDRRIAAFDDEFKAYARSDQPCRPLPPSPALRLFLRLHW